jgi:hypothetical protein
MLRRAMLLFAFLPAMVFGSDFTPGENLITPFEPSVYDGYTEYIKKESGYTSYLWQSDEHGFDDHYVVNVVKGKRDSVRTFRDSQDEPGKRSCKRFKSEMLFSRSRNGYPAELWQTTCELKEMRITTIQLAISGSDNLYHIRKLWRIPVTHEEASVWVENLDKIIVCDTRGEEHPCPTGYKEAR